MKQSADFALLQQKQTHHTFLNQLQNNYLERFTDKILHSLKCDQASQMMQSVKVKPSPSIHLKTQMLK